MLLLGHLNTDYLMVFEKYLQEKLPVHYGVTQTTNDFSIQLVNWKDAAINKQALTCYQTNL